MSVLSRNHFELFGLPVRFEIDAAALDAAYRGVQGAVHPDRHAGGTAADRRVAMQLATHANEAYRTLRDPARRGAYLCALAGVDVEFESNTAMPAQFLMQQIEWREALDDARAARSAAGLQALREGLDDARDALLARLARAIDADGDYVEAAGDLRQMMFLDRFSAEIDDAEERLLEA